MFGFFKIPYPVNETTLQYLPGSAEKSQLKSKLEELKSKTLEIPLIIGGKEVKTGNIGNCIIPHNHKHTLAVYHKAGEKEVAMAIKAATDARKIWQSYSYNERAAIFLKAADLMSGKYRTIINAATILGQSKNVYQAEIDASCESIDFLRYNAYYMSEIYAMQPDSGKAEWNNIEYRPLDGFVFCVTPFNFTAIGVNLVSAPAVMGNTIVWKPATTGIYSAYFIMKVFLEAGIPEGVVNFIPGAGNVVGPMALNSKELGGIHFTGSTDVFKGMWQTVSNNLGKYRSYPKLVGETGGKDFIFAHSSADLDVLKTALIRGAFEYQGQKCSAASRGYIPSSLWPALKEAMIADLKQIKYGDAEDFTMFMGAVIDKSSFNNIKSYIDYAKNSSDAEIVFGGKCDDSVGYFVEPTVILAKTPDFKTIQEEIFGPVLTLYVYNDADFERTLELCDNTSIYGLTGAIIAQDRNAVKIAFEKLRFSAGNFYINDKCTGAVVGKQPFGGARMSGTNDKAGSYLNLVRWVSARMIKENFAPPTDYRYPYMIEK